MATFNSYVSLPEGTSTTLLANPRVSDPQISMLLKQKSRAGSLARPTNCLKNHMFELARDRPPTIPIFFWGGHEHQFTSYFGNIYGKIWEDRGFTGWWLQ